MHHNIKLLMAFNFFQDFRFHSALLVIYFARITGSYTLALSLLSIMILSAAVFEVPTGVFSDRIGRRKSVIIGAFCSTFAAIFYAIGLNFWILAAGVILEGLARSWFSGNNEALLYDTLHSEKREIDYGEYLGRTSSMFQIAGMLGALIGSGLVLYSFSLIMWLSVITQTMCIVIAWRFIEPTIHSPKSGNMFTHLRTAIIEFWKNRKIRLLTSENALNYGVGESVYQFSSVFIQTIWPLWAIGLAKTIGNLAAASSYWFGGTLVKKFGALNLLLTAGVYGISINLFAIAVARLISPILMSSSSFFHGVTQVARGKLLQDEFTHSERATMGSLNSFIGNISFAVFSPLLGLFADLYGPQTALFIGYLFLIPTIPIIYRLKKITHHS